MQYLDQTQVTLHYRTCEVRLTASYCFHTQPYEMPLFCHSLSPFFIALDSLPDLISANSPQDRLPFKDITDEKKLNHNYLDDVGYFLTCLEAHINKIGGFFPIPQCQLNASTNDPKFIDIKNGHYLKLLQVPSYQNSSAAQIWRVISRLFEIRLDIEGVTTLGLIYGFRLIN